MECQSAVCSSRLLVGCHLPLHLPLLPLAPCWGKVDVRGFGKQWKKKIQHCEFSTGQCSLLLILLQPVPSGNKIKHSLSCSQARSLNHCKTSALESPCLAQEMGLLQGNVLHSHSTLQHPVTMPHCGEAGLSKFE